ncbi:hypothetical protein C7C46_27710 [Streptomyces tateyamensis]|uniref:Uncharacterized protein n=1 Tax=Streptomyces tateyamensis TaxID=565073 RepID=A0A2V4NV67_9ACTN|nr:hypothetical protein [Streptomyces tateyamensis]PYC70042.1 hypothetical protein C7C46_27710 [Streptomyces tateyamensis]
MHAEWDNAHTDHTSSATRPGPSGLAETEADWRHHLGHETPNGWLLSDNSMTKTLASGRPIHLMHTTVALDAIRASGHLYASTGCLVAALYCALLIPEPAGLRPHNLGTYLLETKKHTRTLVFEITPDAPVPPKGIDYLRLGAIHLRTYLTHRSFLTEAEDTQLRRAVLNRLRAAAPFLDRLLANAAGTPTPDAEFIDQLAATVPAFPFLGYLYFEVLSEYLMLNSTTAETKTYAQLGEMNNRLYKRLAFSAVHGMDQLFDLSRFNPGHERLLQLVGQIEAGLTAGVARFTRRRLSYLFANVAVVPGQDAASFTFRDADFDTLSATAPHLLGQLIFREMRIINRYPQLYLAFEQAKALEAWDYWNTEGIPTPFNGTIPKGEIGINPAYPHSRHAVWTAETCKRGLLHPLERLDVTFLPSLAELGMTAMRRDKTGKAAGHVRQTASP